MAGVRKPIIGRNYSHFSLSCFFWDSDLQGTGTVQYSPEPLTVRPTRKLHPQFVPVASADPRERTDNGNSLRSLMSEKVSETTSLEAV